MFLLDTHVVSYLSAISLLLGVLQIERRDLARGTMLRAWLDGQVAPAFVGRLLAADANVARRCARLHVLDPCAGRDALITATALTHGMILVTRNTADFDTTGVVVLDP